MGGGGEESSAAPQFETISSSALSLQVSAKIQVMVADPVIIISCALILVLFIYLSHYSGHRD